MVRLLSILLLVALCYHLYGFAKENAADYPALQRYASSTVASAWEKYESILGKGLSALEREVSRKQPSSQRAAPPILRKEPLMSPPAETEAEAPSPAPAQLSVEARKEAVLQSVLDEFAQIDDILQDKARP